MNDNYNNLSVEELEALLSSTIDQTHSLTELLEDAKAYRLHNQKMDERFRKKGTKEYLHGGEYATLFLHPEYQSRWKGSFYDKERMFIQDIQRNTLSIATLKRKIERTAPAVDFEGNTDIMTARVLGFCDKAIPTKTGPVIHLIEPDNEYEFPPFFGSDNEYASLYTNRMLIVRAQFYKNHPATVIEVFVLPFTLYGRITQTEHAAALNKVKKQVM